MQALLSNSAVLNYCLIFSSLCVIAKLQDFEWLKFKIHCRAVRKDLKVCCMNETLKICVGFFVFVLFGFFLVFFFNLKGDHDYLKKKNLTPKSVRL